MREGLGSIKNAPLGRQGGGHHHAHRLAEREERAGARFIFTLTAPEVPAHSARRTRTISVAHSPGAKNPVASKRQVLLYRSRPRSPRSVGNVQGNKSVPLVSPHMTACTVQDRLNPQATTSKREGFIGLQFTQVTGTFRYPAHHDVPTTLHQQQHSPQ